MSTAMGFGEFPAARDLDPDEPRIEWEERKSRIAHRRMVTARALNSTFDEGVRA